MIDAGILDKDYVIVKQQNTANNGEIVVAMTEDDEATVKRFYKEDTHIRLVLNTPITFPRMLTFCKMIGSIVGFSGCKRMWVSSL